MTIATRILDLLEREGRPLTAEVIAAAIQITDKHAAMELLRLRRAHRITRHAIRGRRNQRAFAYTLAESVVVEPLPDDDGWQPVPWRHPYARGAA